MHRVFLPAIAAAAVVILSGCAPEPAPSAPAASSPSATTAAPADDPGPVARVAATCADFIDAAGASALLANATDVREVSFADAEAHDALAPLIQRQYGSLECEWSPGGVPFAASSDEIQVTVAPDVPPARWAELVPIFSSGSGVVVGGFAGETYSNCFGAPHGRFCTLLTSLNGYLLQVELASSEPAAEGVSRTWGNPFLQHAVDVVSALPAPSPRWEPAGSSPVAVDCRALTDDGTLASELGFTAVDIAFIGPTPQDGASWVADAETGAWTCYMQGLTADAATNFRAAILPDGSWGWDVLAATRGAVPLDGVGDEAVIVTGSEEVTVLLRVGTHLASATAEAGFAPAGSDLAAVATAVATRLGAALG